MQNGRYKFMISLTEKSRTRNLVNNLVGFLALGTIFILLISSKTASNKALRALTVCSTKLIPTLFPLLVINSILIETGLLQKIAIYLGKICEVLFGACRSSASAMIIGLLCGAPTGAVAVYELKSKGLCNEEDAKRAVFFSSFVSPAFIISGIGVSMLGNMRLGILIWLIHTASTLCTGIIINIIKKGTPYVLDLKSDNKSSFGLYCISKSIKKSVESMLAICGSVVFFSVLTGYIASFNIFSDLSKCIIFSFFELISGTLLSTELLSSEIAFIVVAAAVSWSGVCIHAQIALVTEGKINLSLFILGKLLSTVLTVLFSVIMIFFKIV